MYCSTKSAYEKPFDSTDKILDEIDAKLNNVSTSNSLSNHLDVNDDPGIDVVSVQKLRQHFHFNSASNYEPVKMNGFAQVEAQANDHHSDVKNSSQNCHEKRTNLLQLYDDDINLLRRMLKENSEDPKPSSSNGIPTERPIYSVSPESPTDVKSTAPSVHWKEDLVQVGSSPLEVSDEQQQQDFLDVSGHTDDTQCSCGCEEELDKMTKERDELRARIRRGEASRTSIEERQELERQLHSTKASLFQQRKKSRQQLEDIEEKLEEAEHYYEEKLQQKDEMIEALQAKSRTLPENEVSDTKQSSTVLKFEEEMRLQEVEIKQLTDLTARKQQEVDQLKLQLSEGAKMADKSIEDKLTNEQKKWEKEYKELKLKSDQEKFEHENSIRRLEQEREKMYKDILDLTQKLQDFHSDIEDKERKIKEESSRKENDHKTTNELLKNKIESLKEELSLAFAAKSELELELRRKDHTLRQEFQSKEIELKDENRKVENELKRVQSEVGSAVTKLKEFKSDIEHQDQCMAASVFDECSKLFHLLQVMQPSSVQPRNTSYTSKSHLNGKKSLSELQEAVELVCRSANELVCVNTRLKRESRKRPDYHSLRSNSDVNLVSEEMKMLRDKLDAKERELQRLEMNMNQWKDLTAQRLAEKFQEELQLQVERKLSQYRTEGRMQAQNLKPDSKRLSKSTNNLNGGAASSPNDTSTVKLLCHLQGRVKQLRTENDLLRSSSFIKGLNKH